MSAVAFSDVSKRFEVKRRDDRQAAGFAVKALTFTVEPGELLAIVGKTGCGKSTMFNLLIGLIAPTEGSVQVLDHDPYRDFDAMGGQVGVVFQNDRLLPWQTALENVAYGLKLRRVDKAKRFEIASSWLKRLSLDMHADKYPHALSGGMRQRISIARAFACDPSILLCDEPFSALDEITGATLRAEFKRLVKETHKTGILVTHSIREALDIGDRVLVLKAPGHVVAEFHVEHQLAQLGESALKVKILEAMGD